MIAFLGVTTTSFVAAPTLHGVPALPALRAQSTPPVVTMLENPLAKFFGGDDKKKKEESALTTGFDALFKDAPLPVKMVAGMVKPLIKEFGNMVAEQAEQGDMLLQEAQGALRADARVTDMLGADVTIGATFSTSSSSSNINGVKTSNMMLQCQCGGSRGQGMVAIRGQSSGDSVSVESLQVQANGQMFDVPPPPAPPTPVVSGEGLSTADALAIIKAAKK